MKKHFLFICFLFVSVHLFAQTISVNDFFLKEYLRRKQVDIFSFETSNSFCISISTTTLVADSLLQLSPQKNKFIEKYSNKILKNNSSIRLLPINVTQQYNGHHPYGWNDAAMIPAAGYQLFISTGIYAKLGKVSIKIQPEIIAAQNPSFETFSTQNYDPIWASYYQWINHLDIPEKFGDGSYRKIYLGQSSIRYNTKNISVGLSTENLWWGPGRRNALVMSNNAPGFLHATFNSVKPIKTKVGFFEFQVIAGELKNSNIVPPETNRVYNGVALYQPKNQEQRYLNGMVLTWQPKWVKGLFVGFAKASYLYKSDISGIADILPLEGIIKSDSDKQQKKSTLGSIFIRYVLFEEQAEFYAEYGRSDRSAGIINLIADKDYPRGYVVGFRKLSDKKPNGSQFEFATEFTQLELPNASLINQAKSWYTNHYVRQGYTNQGQVIGAGIGPGSNSQTIDISWVKDKSKIGLLFERIVRNNDFYYYTFNNPPDYTRHWIDISTTFHADWKYKRFLFSSEIGVIRSLNYEWFVIPGSPYFKNGYDFLNLHGKFSFSYWL